MLASDYCDLNVVTDDAFYFSVVNLRALSSYAFEYSNIVFILIGTCSYLISLLIFYFNWSVKKTLNLKILNPGVSYSNEN